MMRKNILEEKSPWGEKKDYSTEGLKANQRKLEKHHV